MPPLAEPCSGSRCLWKEFFCWLWDTSFQGHEPSSCLRRASATAQADLCGTPMSPGAMNFSLLEQTQQNVSPNFTQCTLLTPPGETANVYPWQEGEKTQSASISGEPIPCILGNLNPQESYHTSPRSRIYKVFMQCLWQAQGHLLDQGSALPHSGFSHISFSYSTCWSIWLSHKGWKTPPKSPSPTFDPTPPLPLNHITHQVPLLLIFEDFQQW